MIIWVRKQVSFLEFQLKTTNFYEKRLLPVSEPFQKWTIDYEYTVFILWWCWLLDLLCLLCWTWALDFICFFTEILFESTKSINFYRFAATLWTRCTKFTFNKSHIFHRKNIKYFDLYVVVCACVIRSAINFRFYLSLGDDCVNGSDCKSKKEK